MLTASALRTTAPLLRRVTLRSLATSADHKVQTLETLEDVESFRQANAKSVLYFTAVWCPPCKQIKPIYHDLSSTTDSVAFGLVDVDDNGDAAMEFNTTSVPTFVFSDGTTTVERLTGADPNQLQKLLKDLADR